MKHLRRLLEAVNKGKDDVEDIFIKLEDLGFQLECREDWLFIEFEDNSIDPIKGLEYVLSEYRDGNSAFRIANSMFLIPRLSISWGDEPDDQTGRRPIFVGHDKKISYVNRLSLGSDKKLENNLSVKYKLFRLKIKSNDELFGKINAPMNMIKSIANEKNNHNIIGGSEMLNDVFEENIESFKNFQKSWLEVNEQLQETLDIFHKNVDRVVLAYEIIHRKLRKDYWIHSSIHHRETDRIAQVIEEYLLGDTTWYLIPKDVELVILSSGAQNE